MAIILRFNVLGIPLKKNDINSILDLKDESFCSERKWICSFFDLKPEELYPALLNRYIEACEQITHISGGSVQENIHTKLINTLASAKRCYSYGEYLACLELSALHGEMLANYLCITSRNTLSNVIEKLEKKDSSKIREQMGKHKIYFSDELNQRLRLRWLLEADVIDDDDKIKFIEVHELRTKYFHGWSVKNHNEKKDALTAIAKITGISAKFLELYDSTSSNNTNVNNAKRVKVYMDIITNP